MLFNRRSVKVMFEGDDNNLSQQADTGVKDGKIVSLKPDNQSSDSGSKEPTMYTIKVDGKEEQVTQEELVVLAQKGKSSDSKFQKAADIQKKHDLLVKGLQEIKEKKDKKAIKELFGIDFEEVKPESKDASEVTISAAEKRLAKQLGLTPEEFLEEKRMASGEDNPMVSELQKQLDAVNKKLEELSSSKKEEKPTSQNDDVISQMMFDKFKELSNERGYSQKAEDLVLDYIERNGISYAKFNEAFEYFDEIFDKGANDRYENKKKKSEKPSGVNVSGSFIDREDLSNMSLNDKAEKLKQMFRNKS